MGILLTPYPFMGLETDTQLITRGAASLLEKCEEQNGEAFVW